MRENNLDFYVRGFEETATLTYSILAAGKNGAETIFHGYNMRMWWPQMIIQKTLVTNSADIQYAK